MMSKNCPQDCSRQWNKQAIDGHLKNMKFKLWAIADRDVKLKESVFDMKLASLYAV